ncbi:hypothetical protein [Spirosoma spitsbergense]|uniref:hypothetical protein n=1 Tax=Spirosoma spitsbergense TaxID=431554 RepID=UPI00036FE6C8|nr:hypothetical protein [Spirosoma spitsbergense]
MKLTVCHLMDLLRVPVIAQSRPGVKNSLLANRAGFDLTNKPDTSTYSQLIGESSTVRFPESRNHLNIAIPFQQVDTGGDGQRDNLFFMVDEPIQGTTMLRLTHILTGQCCGLEREN